MATLMELDHRVSKLEERVREDLFVRMESMNWAVGQMHKSTEATRVEMGILHADMARLDSTLHADMTLLKSTLTSQAGELRHDLGCLESSVRHDMRAFRDDTVRRLESVGDRFESVDRRFESVDARFDAVDARFERVDQRFDGVDAKLDEILAAIRPSVAGAASRGGPVSRLVPGGAVRGASRTVV